MFGYEGDCRDHGSVRLYEAGLRAARSHFAFGAVGTAIGIVAALESYRCTPSWGLSLFVFAMVSYVIARAPRLVGSPHRLQHAAYLIVLPLAGLLVLAAFFLLWSNIGLAAVLGLAGGIIIQAAFNPAIVGCDADDNGDHGTVSRGES